MNLWLESYIFYITLIIHHYFYLLQIFINIVTLVIKLSRLINFS